MTCLWHVRAATDQGAQFAPRIESHPLRQGRPVRLAEPFRPFVHPAAASPCRRGKELFCMNQTLSDRPFYQAKMLPTATPVVHGNRPAGRMLLSWMTALGGRGDVLGPLPPGGNSPPARTLPTFGQDRK